MSSKTNENTGPEVGSSGNHVRGSAGADPGAHATPNEPPSPPGLTQNRKPTVETEEEIMGPVDDSYYLSENDNFVLRPVQSWATEKELADVRAEKKKGKKKGTPDEDPDKGSRTAVKNEAYETLRASVGIHQMMKEHARKKLKEFKLTSDEMKEVIANVMLDAGQTGLMTSPVVKAENSDLEEVPEINPGAKDSQEPLGPKVSRKSAEPMSQDIEGKINSFMDKAEGENKGHRKKSGKRTNERVDNDTFLGKAFRGLENSDPSDSSDSDSSDDTNKGSDDNRRRSKRGKSVPIEQDNEKERTHGRSNYSPIKPTPPEKYSGKANPHLFFKFVSQSAAYCKKGRIPLEDQVQEISYFLTDDAYKFYLNEVSMEEYEWTLKGFMKGLFNYCFPPNYRLKEQQKLERFRQNELRVRPYAAELKNMYNIIGYAHKREKVRKLWSGLQPRLQEKLYENGYDPERNKWGEIVDAAETFEIAREMRLAGEGRRDDHGSRRGGNSGNGGGPGNNGGHPGNGGSGNHRPPSNGGNRHNKSSNGPKGKGKSGYYNNGIKKQKPDRLTETEKARYKAEGRCYKCGEKGHISPNCPDDDKVRSNGSGPPGIRANKISFGEADDLRANDKGLRSSGIQIQVAAIRFSDVTTEKRPKGRPSWKRTRKSQREITEVRRGLGDLHRVQPNDIGLRNPNMKEKLSDPLALRAMYLLESQQPYPGEPSGRMDKQDTRFLVFRISDSEYVIYDSLDDDDEGTVVSDEIVSGESSSVAVRYAQIRAAKYDIDISGSSRWRRDRTSDEPYVTMISTILEKGYSEFTSRRRKFRTKRFRVSQVWSEEGRLLGYNIIDQRLGFQVTLSTELATKTGFDLRTWYCSRVHKFCKQERNRIMEFWTSYGNLGLEEMEEGTCEGPTTINELLEELFDELGKYDKDNDDDQPSAAAVSTTQSDDDSLDGDTIGPIAVYAARPKAPRTEDQGRRLIERNASTPRDPSRLIPDPIVVTVEINGEPARALLDSGSLGDFVSTTLVAQLRLRKTDLVSPLSVQMAAQGSRSKINYSVEANLSYQEINENRRFDVMNLSGYDLILGTPWFFQYKVMAGLNPARVIIGSKTALPMTGTGVQKLASRSIKLYEEKIDEVRKGLIEYARPICKKSSEVPLPPLRAINHEIPLIDESKIYSYRPSRCPEALLSQWNEKKNSYIKTGRWEVTSGRSSAPVMCIPKPGSPPRLRVVVDLRERNANTKKLSSPLPDMEGILRRASKAKYRSLIDGQDAYEQIRVVPEHVHRTTVNTPSGTMVSHVVQQGDCNAPATYQALMNYLFAEYIGRWMDVYLDDIVIYSDSLEEHVKHVKLVIDILKREKLYLSESKLKLLASSIKILGRIVEDDGIRMDPEKVDALVKWKVPTNRDLLRAFLGAAGYLADDIDRVRIPMGVLHGLTSDSVPFRWSHTHQRAFDEVKNAATACRDHHRSPLRYGPEEAPVNVVTDGCVTGIGGVVSQGTDWKTAKVAAFYSAKLSATQQNHPTHEVELLAGVETMLRHRDILQGVPFKWFTDHKGLIHLLQQRDLSPRQSRWMEKLAMFDFEVVYVPGAENILSDALSRLYSNDSPGTVRATSEFTEYDEEQGMARPTLPVLTGLEGGLFEDVGDEGVRMAVNAVTRAMAKKSEGSGVLRRSARLAKVPCSKAPEGGSTDPNEQTPRIDEISDEIPKNDHDQDLVPTSSDDQVLKSVNDVNRLLSGIDLTNAVKNKCKYDTILSKVFDNPEAHRNFEVDIDEGLVYLKEGKRKLLCIPEGLVNGQSIRELVIRDAHTILAHLGSKKTYDYLRNVVWWKTMANDIKSYCDSCITCLRSKPNNQKPKGLLNPLDIPSEPWESIGIDFVGPLPESKDRNGKYDSITVM